MQGQLSRRSVSLIEEFSPRDFLRDDEFSPERADELFPNAREIMLGGLFISHSGADSQRIWDRIILPVVFERLPADGYFMHSGLSGGADSYRFLVQAALHWCDKFMVIISSRSICSSWVLAEVEWALDNSRPIIVVRLDEYEWKDVLHVLGRREDACLAVPPFDFSVDIRGTKHEFEHALDSLLTRLPRRGRYGTVEKTE
jgi:TIR domain